MQASLHVSYWNSSATLSIHIYQRVSSCMIQKHHPRHNFTKFGHRVFCSVGVGFEARLLPGPKQLKHTYCNDDAVILRTALLYIM